MATVGERLRGAAAGFRDPAMIDAKRGAHDEATGPRRVEKPDNFRELYALLEFYRDSEAYANARNTLTSLVAPDDWERLKVLENPAYMAVQYGVEHVFGGPLDEAIELEAAGNPQMPDACETIFHWSNMGAQKDSIVEDQYTLGDVWLQIMASPEGDRVFIDSRHPGDISKFREDNMRNTKMIRLDIPLEEVFPDAENDPVKRTWTEIWDHDDLPMPVFWDETMQPPMPTVPEDPNGVIDESFERKRKGRYRLWIHEFGVDATEEMMGSPMEDRALTEIGGVGADFVPFVRVPRKAGTRPNKRSPGVFQAHLEAIDQLNRLSTELDDTYKEHSDGLWAFLRKEAGADALVMIDNAEREDDSRTEGKEGHYYGRRTIAMPGMSDVADMVPNIDYSSGLDKVEDRRDALERMMAELRYFRGIEGGDPSAEAIRMHQAPAIKAAEAARGHATDAMIRALKMAITWAQARNLKFRTTEEVPIVTTPEDPLDPATDPTTADPNRSQDPKDAPGKPPTKPEPPKPGETKTPPEDEPPESRDPLEDPKPPEIPPETVTEIKFVPFRTLGKFDDQAFDVLTIKPRSIVPETPAEIRAGQLEEAAVMQAWKLLGPELFIRFLVEEKGFERADAQKIAQAEQIRKEREVAQQFAAAAQAETEAAPEDEPPPAP